MKIGFIGLGNMGGAILKGFLSNGVDNDNVYVYDINKSTVESFKETFNINVCNEYEDLVKKVDFLIFAVKPDIILDVMSYIKYDLQEYKPTIISIAAGVSIDSIYNAVGYDNTIGIVRIMPNINAEVSLSTSAYCYENVNKVNLDFVIKLFKNIGSLFHIEENKFDIFTAIAGCSPAYVYLFLDSLAKGAQKMGLNKKEALNIAIDVLIGSANMLKNGNKHPWELIDNVCSPGGTTIEGICTLEENNFPQAIVKAVENTIKKDRSLNNTQK